MTLDWQPTPEKLAPYATRAGLTIEHFTPETTAGFVSYHEARGQVQTEKQWLAALVSWIRRDLAKSAKAIRPQANGGAASFDDNDTSWIDKGARQ